MNFLKKHISLFRGLTAVFAVLFALILIVAEYMTGVYRGKIEEMTGSVSGAVVRSEDIEDYKYKSDYSNTNELMAAEKAFVTRVEEEGAVLLKGTPADLKVGGNKNVSLFGMRSVSNKMNYNGAIGGVTNTALQVSLEDALAEEGFHINQELRKVYRDNRTKYETQKNTNGSNEMPANLITGVSNYASYNDAAIVVFGRASGESYTFTNKGALALDNTEKGVLNYVKQRDFNKIIVLLNTASPMEIEELKNDEEIDAVLLMGNPGAYGNCGIARLLAGEVLPSGHLPDTYAVNNQKAPSAQNYGSQQFSGSGLNNYNRYFTVEEEGIYIGYKYYETRYYDTVFGNGNASAATGAQTSDGSIVWNYDKEVTYAFGYGIEGSKFTEEITETDIDWTGATDSTVKVKVTNTGSVAAKHAVQLYVHAPYTSGGLEKSAIQLVAYGKTGEQFEKDFTEVVNLEPGESNAETLTLTFNAKDFSSYDSSYAHDGVKGAYVLDAGDYYFATGNGAHEAVQAVIKAEDSSKLSGVTVSGDVKKVNNPTAVAITKGVNDTLIQNQLEDMDFTYSEYGNAFTSKGAKYLSRTDWNGTFPTTVNGVAVNDYMMKYLSLNGTYDKAAANAAYDGPVYTDADFGQTGYTVRDIAGVTDYDNENFEKVISCIDDRGMLSGYVAGGPAAINSIFLDAGHPSDSPVGIIIGYGTYTASIAPFADAGENKGTFPAVFTGEPVLAATFSHLLASEMGRLVGNDGLWIGCYWWFGPGMNLHRSPYNGRNNEYYSEDSVLTGCMATDVTVAAQAKGIAVCAKHFAFNDIEQNREGIAPFGSEQAARENELRGFEFAFVKGGMKSTMTGFNRVGVTYSSAHYGLVTGICRGEWGHKGLVITDSVKEKSYERAAECLIAGTDFMLGGNGRIDGAWENISPEAAANDPVIMNALRTAMHRYLYTLADTGFMDGYPKGELTLSGAAWWEKALLAGEIVLGVLAGLAVCAWVASFVLGKFGKKEEAQND